MSGLAISGAGSAVVSAESDPNLILNWMIQKQEAEQRERARMPDATQSMLGSFQAVAESVRQGQSQLAGFAEVVATTRGRQDRMEREQAERSKPFSLC
eukprot:5511621-Alexandrium_andersonii.AAC.1